MRRRDFVAGIGGVAASTLTARAQQRDLPLIGFLNLGPKGSTADPVFFEGLAKSGFVIGRNARIEYRWAEDLSQIPALAAEIVRLRPRVISASPTAGALAIKAATSAIPVVFATGEDPVKIGLVASFNRPGGNLTGVTNITTELEGKRLELIHGIIAADRTIAVLVNSKHPNAEQQENEITEAAQRLGRKIVILKAANEDQIDDAFKAVVHEKLGALYVGGDYYFVTRRAQIVALAAFNAIPAIYQQRAFVDAGGLASYGYENKEFILHWGVYVGRVLKGERPADLPVVRPVKFELVLNLQTAKRLGLTFPPAILALADAVIE